MRIKNKKNFWAGLMFMALGAFFVGFGTQYTIGTAAKMGPGYFPTALSVSLILLGIIIFGAIGYLFRLEDSLRQSIVFFRGDYLKFFMRPLSGIIVTIAILVFLSPLIKILFFHRSRKRLP